MVSLTPAKCGEHRHHDSGDNHGFSLWRALARPHDQRCLWLYWLKLLVACNHPARFGGYKNYESRNLILIYHLTSCEHMFKGFCDFMAILPSLMAIGFVVVEIQYFRWSCKTMWLECFYDWNEWITSLYIPHPVKYGSCRQCGNRYIIISVCHVIWQDCAIIRLYDS